MVDLNNAVIFEDGKIQGNCLCGETINFNGMKQEYTRLYRELEASKQLVSDNQALYIIRNRENVSLRAQLAEVKVENSQLREALRGECEALHKALGLIRSDSNCDRCDRKPICKPEVSNDR